ncbi:amidase domain-containing protein [Anaerobium acetethylicum]|uniref:Putative amidase domain-containing protein n=1 Tax=Anaerobium acetethylicum TaxID=1619234 RepID=A0A1D3TUN1_9FIRM|nr:amidase domain-containing protein [Anaerobium acetethylicum]SCP97788.1 Putative amidase domain-containing protein [Anaerobium acetethylicum]
MKKTISFLLAIVMTISLQTVALAQTNSQMLNSDYEEVKSFVSSYFDVIDKSLSELSISPELKNYYKSENCLEYISIDTTIQHRLLQISDLHYSDYKTTLSFEDISYDGESFNVIVDKNTDMYFNCFKGEPSSIYERHIIDIVKSENDTFRIVSDNYSDEIKDLLKLYRNFSNTTMTNNIEKAKNILLQESKNNVALQKSELELLKNEAIDNKGKLPAEEKNILSGFGFHAYNRNAAQSYAYTYVLSPNSSYVNFESMGGNCTNFTSQCLRAGGIPFDEIGGHQWYYYNSTNRAPAWTSANYFRTYYKNNVGSSSIKGIKAVTSDFASMRLGDLVQLVSSGTASHSMFISSPIYDNWGSDDPWKYKYDVGICQNSTSVAGRQKNIPLSTKPTNREYVHIEGSYY